MPDEHQKRFAGYDSPHYTQIPDQLFDEQLPDLSGSELKALLYIMRHTFGWRKDADKISISQIMGGITARDGRVIDRGTGLSKQAVVTALKGLEDQNIIVRTKRASQANGYEATSYAVNVVPLSKNLTRASQENGQRLVQKVDIQDTNNNKHEDNISIDRQQRQERGNVDNSALRPQTAIPDPSTIRQVHTKDKSDGERHPAPGFHRVGEVLENVPPPAAPPYDEARQVIADYVADFARELGDEAKLKASVTRLTNLYHRSGVDLGAFTAALYEARSRTKMASASIKKLRQTEDGHFAGKNKFPYFAATVEDLLGLRKRPPADPSRGDPSP
jgi:phage replication O-like protein O